MGRGRREREREREREDILCIDISLDSLPPSINTESHRLGQPSFTLLPGTGGVEVAEEVVTWCFDYSGWELLALETCQIFHTPGVGTGEKK